MIKGRNPKKCEMNCGFERTGSHPAFRGRIRRRSVTMGPGGATYTDVDERLVHAHCLDTGVLKRPVVFTVVLRLFYGLMISCETDGHESKPSSKGRSRLFLHGSPVRR